MNKAKLGVLAHRLFRSIWFYPIAWTIFSLATIGSAPFLGKLAPQALVDLLNPGALRSILQVLASSMLAVAIFSLGTMVSSLEAAASVGTPRARVLLTEDRTAQVAISTFIGAFIFSIFAIIGLSTGYYAAESAVVLFLVTIVIITIVIITLITWIGRLSKFGGVHEVAKLVEQAAFQGFEEIAHDPLYGGKVLENSPANVHDVTLGCYGFIQHIEGERLGSVAEERGIDLYLLVRPGALVNPGTTVLWSSKSVDDETLEQIRSCFLTGEERTFEEDPKFALLVLSEIASKALSPAINDPGTAIHVINRMVRVVQHWDKCSRNATPAPRVSTFHVKPFDFEDAIRDSFRPVARDGASYLEVGLSLQKALTSIGATNRTRFYNVTHDLRQDALARAKKAMKSPDDFSILEASNDYLAGSGRPHHDRSP